MYFTHYDSIAFDDLNVNAKIDARNKPAGPSRMPVVIQRDGAPPLLSGMTEDIRAFTVTMQVQPGNTLEQTLAGVLGALEGGFTEEKMLDGYLGDTSSPGDAVRIMARVGGYRYDGYELTTVYVDFYTSDPVWRALEDSATDPASVALIKGANGFVVPLDGKARAWPTIKVAPAAGTSRSSKSQTVGWQYRKTVDITNETSRDWHNQIVFVEIGDTAALVTGTKALSAGDDYRVFCNGRQLPRSFIGWNTTMTVMGVRVSIPAGETCTLDMVYGNASATANDPYDFNTGCTLTTALGVVPTYPDVWTPVNFENAVGTASGGAASTMTGVTGGDGKWDDGYVAIYGGTGATQFRKITTFAANVVNVSRAWTTNPDATSKYIVWSSGLHVDGGRASAGAASTLTDASQAWKTNEWEGATLILQSGTGSGQTATVTSNTATVLTISGTWGTNPDNTTGYRIQRAGVYDYFVDITADLVTLSQNNHGGWYVSNTRPNPSSIRYGDKIAGAWTPDLYLANNDDVAQSRSRSGSSDDTGVLRARRSKASTHGYPGQGQADGVSLYVPIGLQGTYFGYRLGNINGKGKGLFSVQAAGGEDWANVVEDSTTHATVTSVAADYYHLTDYGTPSRAGFFIVPANDTSFDSAATGDEAELRWNTALKMFYDVDGITVGSVSAEEDIYDAQGTIYLGGGQLHDTPPFTQIEFGGDGSEGRSCFLSMTGGFRDTLAIRLDPNQTTDPIVSIDNQDGTVVPAAYAATIAEAYTTLDGDVATGIIGIGGSLKPGPQRLTNPSFDSNATGYTGLALDGSVTGTFTRHGGATYYGSTAGSGLVTISANGVTGGLEAYQVLGPVFPVRAGELLELQYACRTTTANLRPLLTIMCYTDTAGTAGGSSPDGDSWNYNPSSGTWYPRVYSGTVQSDRVSARVRLIVESDAAVTGSIYFDDMHLDGTAIYYEDARETGMPETDITVTWRDGWQI